jgi:hypothetical protein
VDSEGKGFHRLWIITRGEVEWICLPYAAWVMAGAAIHRARAHRMLLAQVVTALLNQALVKSPW